MHMISISFLNCYDLAKPNFGELHAAAVFVQGLDVWDAWSFFKLLDLDRGDSCTNFQHRPCYVRGMIAWEIEKGEYIWVKEWYLLDEFAPWFSKLQPRLEVLWGFSIQRVGGNKNDKRNITSQLKINYMFLYGCNICTFNRRKARAKYISKYPRAQDQQNKETWKRCGKWHLR